jgi:hypothetical protein
MRETINAIKRETVFDSWHEFIEYCDKAPSPRALDSLSSHTGQGHAGSGTSSFADAVSLAYTGWTDGASRIKTITSPIFDKVSQLIERQDMVFDVEGIGIDVARYLDGEPECWQKWETRIVDGPGTRIIRLGYNLGAYHAVSEEHIIGKGAVACALVELLEYAGNRVEVYGLKNNTSGGCSDRTSVLLKSADQNLDVPRLAYALSHPSMARRLLFSVLERMPNNWNNFAYGYGKPDTLPVGDQHTYDIYIPPTNKDTIGSLPDWNSGTAAQKWIITQLQAQGVTLQGS